MTKSLMTCAGCGRSGIVTVMIPGSLCSACRVSFTSFLDRFHGPPRRITPGWKDERAHERATIWGERWPW